ncbi:MAG: cytochrome-c peroxidase [Bacteroidetes bacterium]|nr:cytochrome-c peroxidase [Bacteroidota bacterium]
MLSIFSFVLILTFQRSADVDGWKLCTYCPPGFELNENNECESRTLYMQYNSLYNKGVGGLKTALPEGRHKFSPQQIDLGRYLFFDPVLSSDNSLSCANCHKPDLGFSDGLGRSVGMNGLSLSRSSPSLWNVAYLNSFFWDARGSSLEMQMQGPLYSEEEMGTNPEQLLSTLNSVKAYQNLFAQAFPNRKSSDEISLNEIYTSIAAFESSLISLNSRYDQYAHGFHEALNEQEIEGLNIFRSFVARCAECHTPPLFTNQQIAVLGTPEPEGMPFDPGTEIPFNDPTLRGGFKVPGLRNIEKTAPYMHSGKFETLRETVQFYTDGRGHAVPDGEELILHWHIWEPNLSDYELDRLVDFLKTLTDESFKPSVPDQLPSGLEPII